ncbi:uncharacterized protein LOC120667244 isoform X1 [Panicum virgatum]|uniref:uncharacterized protein LOC120667244 isoform X1 n=1 Tax=Panicum virgatum TaxID=38727 RepID=UPI0019D5782D|nr:uncharacterized protein LOC120667244 isoform X1 [Panicum virgatum]
MIIRISVLPHRRFGGDLLRLPHIHRAGSSSPAIWRRPPAPPHPPRARDLSPPSRRTPASPPRLLADFASALNVQDPVRCGQGQGVMYRSNDMQQVWRSLEEVEELVSKQKANRHEMLSD